MLFVRDKGRMCNNLLQFGHVYAWAREHGRQAVSMRFAYKYPYFHIGHTHWHSFVVYVLAKYAAKLGLLPVATFDNPAGNPEALRLLEQRRWLVVEGWEVRFYDLFLKYKEEIKALFAFNADIENSVMEQTRLPLEEGKVLLGVHIRRGDYKTWQGGRYYYDDDVYIDYIRRFAASQAHPVHVFVCGNDPSLDQKRYTESLPGVDITFANGNPGEDLCLLSHCHYIIGAPSTFSLTASMYHDNQLCWMMSPLAPDEQPKFDTFDNLFRHII